MKIKPLRIILSLILVPIFWGYFNFMGLKISFKELFLDFVEYKKSYKLKPFIDY